MDCLLETIAFDGECLSLLRSRVVDPLIDFGHHFVHLLLVGDGEAVESASLRVVATDAEHAFVVGFRQLTHASVADAFAEERVEVKVMVGQEAQCKRLLATILWLINLSHLLRSIEPSR